MARHFEYVIHGPPLSPQAANALRRKGLSMRKERPRTSSLRAEYHSSESPVEHRQQQQQQQHQLHSPTDDHVTSPTTPTLPPTPPIGEEDGETTPQQRDFSPQPSGIQIKSLPATPVNGNSPPTPEDTPPRDLSRLPLRPLLHFQPSMTSTYAESFRTAKEQIQSDDESEHDPSQARCGSLEETPRATRIFPPSRRDRLDTVIDQEDQQHQGSPRSPPSSIVEATTDPSQTQAIEDLQEQQLEPNHDLLPLNSSTSLANQLQHPEMVEIPRRPSIHAQVTLDKSSSTRREKSLRDRLKETEHLQRSASTEAFANVIGWNDGGAPERKSSAVSSKRLSDHSNPSAIEAYVVESPIKPRKRGTLRKVVKNDSLRSTSSPIPEQYRTSLQSTSDSPHRLVHKKQRLNNHTRWSTGSDISKRTLSWGSAPTWTKQDTITVAVIPERRSSLQNSASTSRRHSRSFSATSGNPHAPSAMPPVTTPGPRRKRAFSDSQQHTPPLSRPPQIPFRTSSLSAPTSRSASRANSITSHQFSMQREQAEKDLRSTLERMESERLSSSLRRSSHQSSSSPTPHPKQDKFVHHDLGPDNVADEQPRKLSSAAGSVSLKPRPMTIEISQIPPGSKEWADLRPSTTLSGTPFSQASMISMSPEIIEARVINFFPHNNNSLQLIEPNRVSETPAVKALHAPKIEYARATTASIVKITTPRMDNNFPIIHQSDVDSPLRNPRKPPDPPTVEFTVIPPTPRSELNNQLLQPFEAPAAKPPTTDVNSDRPPLRPGTRSESFIKTISRGLSLRNAKNPKADQELDSTLHPFWRPRAFWDDEDYKQPLRLPENQSQVPELDNSNGAAKNAAILDPSQRLLRSNSIATGPLSLARRISERRRQRKIVDNHIAQQQALVKQTSYSSLQKFRAGHKLLGLQPIRSLSLNVGIERLGSLRDRLAAARARKEDERRELRRDKLRKSIGSEVVPQSDSRFPGGDIGTRNQRTTGIEHLGGYKVSEEQTMREMLEHAKAENLVEKRGLRM